DRGQRGSRAPLDCSDDGVNRLQLAEEVLGVGPIVVLLRGDRLQDRSVEIDLDDLLVLVDEGPEGAPVDAPRPRGGGRGRRRRRRRAERAPEEGRRGGEGRGDREAGGAGRGARAHGQPLLPDAAPELPRTAGAIFSATTRSSAALRVAARARAV